MEKKRIRKCCVKGCEDVVSMRHRFPKNDPALYKQWINIIKPQDWETLSVLQVYNRHLVCHAHFEKCYHLGSLRGLTVHAVPTLGVSGVDESMNTSPKYETEMESPKPEESESVMEVITQNDPLYIEKYPQAKESTALSEQNTIKICSIKTVKDQCLQVKDCHGESLQKQKKRSTDEMDHEKPRTYQKQEELLIPNMSNNPIRRNLQDSSYSSSPLIADDYVDDSTIKIDHIETPRKRVKHDHDYMSEHIQSSDKRARSHQILENEEQSHRHQNDALYQFFLSMFNTTINLPARYQREIRNKVYEAVTQAEEKYENDHPRDSC